MAQDLIASLVDFQLITQLANHRHIVQHPLLPRKTQPGILKKDSRRAGITGRHLGALDRRGNLMTTIGTVKFVHTATVNTEGKIASGKIQQIPSCL